jgi:thiol-disulfide isomerase/thioredoxin
MRRLARAIPVAALLAGLIGCGGGGSGAAPPPQGQGKKAGATVPVEVSEVSFETLDAALREQRGAVVLVDFWALWCEPCVAGFPHFVELHKKYADRGLTCISVSMDRQSDLGNYKPERVLAFLRKVDATFPNFILADPDRDAARLKERFGKGYGIPYSVLFDREGNRIGDTLPGSPTRLTLEQIDKKIEEELAN